MKVKSVSPATTTVGTKAEMAGEGAAPAAPGAAMDPGKMMEMLMSLTEQVAKIHEALGMLVEAAQAAGKAEPKPAEPEAPAEAEVEKPEDEVAEGEAEPKGDAPVEEMSDEEVESELEKVSAELEAVAS